MATQAEVAAHLDLSDRWVRKLLADGVLPGSKGKGGYDLEDCRLAYIRHLRGLGNAQVKPEPDPDSGDIDPLTEYRLRLTAAQDFKNEVTRKWLIATDFISFAFANFIPAAGSIFNAVDVSLRRRHPNLASGKLDTIG